MNEFVEFHTFVNEHAFGRFFFHDFDKDGYDEFLTNVDVFKYNKATNGLIDSYYKYVSLHYLKFLLLYYDCH